MTASVVLVHTVPGLVEVFTAYCHEELPGASILHILDEPLLLRVRQRGHIDRQDDDRLGDHVNLAEQVGASAVLVTCSTVSDSVQRVRERASIPVFAADDSMAAEAVRLGSRIAVVATAATTLEPSRRRLETAATGAGRSVEVSTRLVEGALAALRAGDPDTHDRWVIAAVREVAVGADVVVLAQATMARIVPTLERTPLAVPVLASPRLALADVRRAIHADASEDMSVKHEVSR